jgi:hypothetical protein
MSCRRLAFAGCETFGRWELSPHTSPLSAALGLSCRRLAIAGNEMPIILRVHLPTRKIIRWGGLQRRNVCCTHRRRHAGEVFYRGRGGISRAPPSPLRSASPAIGSLPRATNTILAVESTFSRRCTNQIAVGIFRRRLAGAPQRHDVVVDTYSFD